MGFASVAAAVAPSLVSSVFGDKGPGITEQINNQDKATKQLTATQLRTQWAVNMAMADQYGINRLTALGAPTAGSPSVNLTSPEKKGPDLNALGQGIDRALNVGRADTQRKLDELALEKAQLSNDYLRTQISGAQKAIANTSPTTPYDNKGLSGSTSNRLPLQPSDLVDIVKDRQTTKSSKDTGRTAGNHSGFMRLDLGGGNYTEVPVTDGGSWAEAIGELPFFYKYPKMAEIMGKRLGYKLRKPIKKYKKLFKR